MTKKATIEFRLKALADTYINIQYGLRDNGANDAFFDFDETGGTADNWRMNTQDSGGASTLVDSGILSDTSYHIFRIECFPAGEIHWYIDAVECGNSPVTTNIPSDYIAPYFYIRTREDAAKSMDIDYVVCRQEI